MSERYVLDDFEQMSPKARFEMWRWIETLLKSGDDGIEWDADGEPTPTFGYGQWQINVYTIAPTAGVEVPDIAWSTAFGPTPSGVSFASGVWTFSVPGIWEAKIGCRFQNSEPVTTAGIVNFSVFVPGGNITDTQTSVPITSGIFVANPANVMQWDTGADLSDNEVHHLFYNATDADIDVGYVNVCFQRIGPSAS